MCNFAMGEIESGALQCILEGAAATMGLGHESCYEGLMGVMDAWACWDGNIGSIRYLHRLTDGAFPLERWNFRVVSWSSVAYVDLGIGL